MEEIQIALASDANYFPGLLVTSASLARHASREVALTFHVLDGGIGADNLAFLREKLAVAHPQVAVKTYDVDATKFADFPEWTGGSRMTYARLLLAELVADAAHLWYRTYGELTGLTMRQARRKFIGWGEYCKRRLAYWLVATPVVCSCFFFFLKFVGRGLCIPHLKGERL